MADGHGTGELGQNIVGEYLRDQAHALDIGEVKAIGGGDAGRLLAAMLQGVKCEISLAGCFGVAVNGDYAALFAKLGVFDREQGRKRRTGFAAIGRAWILKGHGFSRAAN